jgi:cytoskeleton protein RodZ
MPESIGTHLRHAREAKNLTIKKVEQATRIRAHQIEAIEADDFEALPSLVQARAFLRLYADFLGVSFEDMVASLKNNTIEPPDQESSLEMVPEQTGEQLSGKDQEPPLTELQTGNRRLKSLLTRFNTYLTNRKNRSKHDETVDSNVPVIEKNQDNADMEDSKEGILLPPSEPLRSQTVFRSIGDTLRLRRESLSLSLIEVERHTRVGKHYLQALEAGDFDQLPSSVQARGMLVNYARFLDLDVDALLLIFAEGLQTQRLEKIAIQDAAIKKPLKINSIRQKLSLNTIIPAGLKRYFSVDIFVGGGLILLLLGFAFWGTSRIINLRAGTTPQPTALSILNILESTPEAATVSATPTMQSNGDSALPPVASESMVLTMPAIGRGPIQVVVIAEEQAWVRVTVDFIIQFEGRVTAGTAYPYDGKIQIEVLTGNGRVISILYNQNNLGPMGNLGEVVDRIYTADAILNPTATFTPTPTISPTPTATLRPSATPRPSRTPRVTITPGP